MTATPEHVAEMTPKQRRSAERKRLKLASLNDQLAWFASPDRQGEGFQPHELRADVKRIQKRIARLAGLTPWGRWYHDAINLRLDRGGEFPPTDEQGVPLMVRAAGETCYYPAAYLTTSGHSWDTYIIALHAGASPLLYEDGYNGSRVTIYDLCDRDRRQVRRAVERGHQAGGDRLVTNVF